MFRKSLPFILFLAAFLLSYAQQKPITLEGTVQMWIITAEGEGGVVDKWRETDFDNEYLNFVLHTDKSVNITPYVNPDEMWEDDDDLIRCRNFTLRNGYMNFGKDFASKYANRRVRITGTLSVSQAGWRNSPPVLFDVKEIDLLNDIELRTDDNWIDLGKVNTNDMDYDKVDFFDTVMYEEGEGEKIFTFVEEEPSFPGGMDAMYKFIAMNLNYPEKAIEKGITGTVLVKFVVEKDGSITHIRVTRDIGGGCGDEVIRMMKAMPRWKPGKSSGKPVRVEFMLPVAFKLQ